VDETAKQRPGDKVILVLKTWKTLRLSHWNNCHDEQVC